MQIICRFDICYNLYLRERNPDTSKQTSENNIRSIEMAFSRSDSNNNQIWQISSNYIVKIMNISN